MIIDYGGAVAWLRGCRAERFYGCTGAWNFRMHGFMVARTRGVMDLRIC